MKTQQITFTTLMVAMLLLLWGCEGPDAAVTTKKAVTVNPAEAKVIAKEAYIYGFPMVVNYKTMYMYTVNKKSPEYKGPFNYVSCEARLYTPEDKAVVTPNADTPYCTFWVDIRTEPVVIEVPEMEPERFYHFQLIDLYTHNFAFIGTLTTGNKAGRFLIAGPGWEGKKPDGIKEVIRCETSIFFVVVRTQLFDPEDIDAVKKIQDAYDLQPLSAYLDQKVPAAAPPIDFPEWKEGDQFDTGFFACFDFMLSLIQPVPEEKELMVRFAQIGLGTDEPFDLEAFSPQVQQALAEGVKEGFAEMEAFIARHSADPLASAKIFGTRDFLQQSAAKNYNLPDLYILRAVAAHRGLYGNSAAEAIYPTYLVDGEGKPLNASENKYTLTFKKGQLPPVKAFWSLTMYDGRTQLFIDNPLDRYLLNSTMMDQFKKDSDGSITFYIQTDSPGKEKESNWLPAPDGPFYMVMRLYGPKTDALEGKWTPPVVMKTVSLSDAEIENIVRRSYQYVAMYNVNNKNAMLYGSLTGTSGWNFGVADTQLKDHTYKAIARPNNDTLYGGCMLDLRNEPIIVHYPAFDSKYVVLETSAYDHYVDIPLSTTKGDFKKPVKILFYTDRTKNYSGEPVEGVDKIMEMTGDFVVAFLRVMPHAAEPERMKKNLAAMHQVKAQTLSEYRGKPAKTVDEAGFPAPSTDAGIFENNFLEVMQFVFNHTTFDPGNKMDRAVLAALKPLGVEPGKQYDPKTVANIDGKKFADIAQRIAQEAVGIWTNAEGNPYLNDVFMPKEQMTLDPMVVQSAYGPIGLPSHQAVYPGISTDDGEQMNAQHDYVIRMSKDQMPPAKAFWSVTLYDSTNGFFIPNDYKKYSVGENAGFKLDKDGGIEIYIAAEKPEGVPEENWLPINRKDEGLDLVMRIYEPDLEKMKTWTDPKSEKNE